MVEQTACAVVARQCLRCMTSRLLEPGDGTDGGTIGVLDPQGAAAKPKEVVAAAIQIFKVLDIHDVAGREELLVAQSHRSRTCRQVQAEACPVPDRPACPG